jgi:hypothetical protein
MTFAGVTIELRLIGELDLLLLPARRDQVALLADPTATVPVPRTFAVAAPASLLCFSSLTYPTRARCVSYSLRASGLGHRDSNARSAERGVSCTN